MKTSTLGLLALGLLAERINAHYVFSVLLANKTAAPAWTYVRDVGIGVNANYDPQWANTALTKKDFTCGYDAWKPNRNQTLTADIIAGSEVGMRMDTSQYARPEEAYVFHIGPAQAYLAKAPDSIDDLSSWDPTDADWFKVGIAGAYNETTWFLEGLHNKDWNFTIPASTPPGKYLLRHEQFWPSPYPDGTTYSGTQFYINCAQINIIGSGGGTPGPTIKFPGGYTLETPGMVIPKEIQEYNRTTDKTTWTTGFVSYVPPGPKVWTG